MTRSARGLFAVAAMVAAGWVAGCAKHEEEVTLPSSRTRYDCLIVRNGGEEVKSKEFPAFHRADAAPEDGPCEPSAERAAPLLGTEVRIAVYGVTRPKGEDAIAEAMGRIAELSRKLNIFDPKSDASLINRDAATRPVPLDADLERIIDRSREIAELSGGAFDATVGPLTALWRENRVAKKLPADDEIARARALVGFDKVQFSGAPGRRTVKFAREGMSFDFGGIAKGYAAEEAMKTLYRQGIRAAVVACAGSIKLMGLRGDGRPFRVGISDPRPPHVNRYVVPLTDASIDTSGNYIQFTMIDGKRYSHIIDPRTGQAIEALPSVTVVGPDGTMCDALSTTIGILGVDEGLKLIDRLNGDDRPPVERVK